MRALVKKSVYRVFANDRAFGAFIGWRRSALKNSIVSRHGNTVLAGPLKGLRLDPAYSELPKYLGTYESALHDWLRAALTRGYDTIINIGCAEGYYAVGMARLLPQATILAFDTSLEQQAHCRRNAELNGVAGRVSIAGEFSGAMFAQYADRRTLVICDIEGGEIALLKPDLYPALARMDLMVELHAEHMAEIVPEFTKRFSATHTLEHLTRRYPANTDELDSIFPNEKDQLAAFYENRNGPTSWMVMTRRG